MQLFKTEMIQPPPPHVGAYRSRRRRYGCRTAVAVPLTAQPLADALRRALPAMPSAPPVVTIDGVVGLRDLLYGLAPGGRAGERVCLLAGEN